MIFATNNQNKLKELQKIFNNQEILCLKDLNINIDILENGNSYYENALIKAREIYNITKKIDDILFSDIPIRKKRIAIRRSNLFFGFN